LIGGKGSKLLHKSNDENQSKFYAAIKQIKHSVLFLEGCFGGGKSGTLMNLMGEIHSSFQDKPPRKIIYVTGENKAIDDAANRYRAILDKNELPFIKIIRCHALELEKSYVYNRIPKISGPSRYKENVPLEVSDDLVHAVQASYFIDDIGKKHQETVKLGDKRRVLQDLSLAAAIYNYAKTHAPTQDECSALIIAL
jgi:hypothetical protein